MAVNEGLPINNINRCYYFLLTKAVKDTEVKFLVLGAGKMGYAVTYDLIRSPKVEKVVIADKDVKKVQVLKETIPDEKILPIELDVTNQEYVAELMANANVTLSCLPYQHNYELAKLALSAKSNFCELGHYKSTEQIYRLDDLAKEQGVTIIPELGLAPGLVSILAVCAADSMEELYEIRIRVGAIPQEPESLPLAQGQITNLLDEYIDPCTVIKDGKTFQIPALSEVETIEFPKPIGTLEAFSTAGGISSLPSTYKGQIKHLDFKSLRYPGHFEKIKLLGNLGLFDQEAIELSSGEKVAPKEVFTELLKQKLDKNVPDLVVLRVTVTGVSDRKPIQHVWECIDYSDEADNISALERMNAFPASIVAQMIAREDIKDKGVLKQETVVPAKLFLAELASRGISLTMTERAPAYKD